MHPRGRRAGSVQSQCRSSAVGGADVIVEKWTGGNACQLQAALRLTNEGYAAHLGIAVRTVAGWHERPEIVPRAEMQQVLDSVLERLHPAAAQRFAALAKTPSEPVAFLNGAAEQPSAHLMRTAIAIVIRGSEVLLVCRRSDRPSWQFPAGIVKPESSPEVTAVGETLSETGVTCRTVENLGNRIHPATGVHCEYILCEYLAGEARNLDVAENIDVLWAQSRDIGKFIEPSHIFGPVRTILENVCGN